MPKLIDQFAKKLMTSLILDRMDKREDAIAATSGSHSSADESPRRFHIMREGMKRGHFSANRMKSFDMLFSVTGIFTSMRSLKKNPAVPRKQISVGELKDFEDYLHSQGISSIGYTRVPARWVFKEKAVMYKNAIVTTMEMDREKIATAPEPAAGEAAHAIYHYQGRGMNRGANFLRQRGHAAHAGHPLMGLALYTPLAQLAGLGNLGASGLFITPEHGPRVRLAAIFTNIENLPFNTERNAHGWVMEYCASCQLCVRKCPRQAIYGAPVEHENGQITCIDNDVCFPFFMSSNGCAVCIKVCPFNSTPFETIREEHQAGRAESLRPTE